ncbi:MAG TPA: apolipoprotein N-acyltransferase [Bryobacteraceae bacterium]|nr:apolipoprotein N-acyltransferase [Bryobacteraceae bacterium]
MIVNWILALASAGLLVLLFPPFNLYWLSPIALAPLLIACAREASWRWRFGFGYAAGIVYWFGICHWIQWTLAHHAAMGDGLAWFLFALFCLAKALQMGIFASLSGLLIRKSYAVPAIAALWVAIEWTHSYTGFEWLNLGNAASDLPLPLRLAPFTGVWGISFSLAMIAVVVALIATRAQRHPAFWLAILPALYFLPDVPPTQPGTAGAVVVQPNIDDEAIWTADLLRDTERQMRLFSLSVAGREGETSIIVWPEVPAPFYESDPDFINLLSGIARQADAAVLSGVVAHAGNRGPPLNSALLLNSSGAVVSRYDKVNLVPFGEFVPWPFGLVTQKVSTEAGDFTPGTKVVVSPIDGHKIGTFICYESVFPSYIRKFADSGAEVLFNISNDSWFGKSAARYQHLLIVRMRAAENRRWIVRSTNDGVSGVVDPAGRVVRTLPEFEESSARLPYGYVSGKTFYTRFGDWFVLLCWLGAAAAVTSAVLPARRRL